MEYALGGTEDGGDRKEKDSWVPERTESGIRQRHGPYGGGTGDGPTEEG